MKIGNTELEHGLFLAPMAGYSDRAMRLLCKEFGAEYCVSEMVSAKAVCYGDKKTPSLAKIGKDETPCAIQLFGSEPEFMARAASMMENGADGGEPPAAIDINMGCPVHKIVANGEGSALMKNPRLAYDIVSAVKKAVKIPVTVKIRSGWDDNSINAPELAKILESAGADAICVHARTRTQLYSGKADPNVVGDVKKSVKIPVIASGDITSYESADAVLKLTGCDGLMIGRGAVGRPFLFKEIICGMDGIPYEPPTSRERAVLAIRHLELLYKIKGEYAAVTESRKQLGEYFRGLPLSAYLRAKLNSIKDYSELLALLREFC